MIYNDFKGLKLSALGFGAMRLPVLEDGSIDVELTEKMVDYAISNGVNYFDTAVPYHGGKSEIVMGEILRKYPRDKWYLATKFPGHQHNESFDTKAIFEEQLRKCGVDRFDFYLFHNVCENSIDDYMNPKWGMLEYMVEQRKAGRIGHLGLSTHGDLEFVKNLLEGPYGKEIEFIQIQLNYLDWTLQKAKEKVELLSSYGIPVWVMEPVRGGRLAKMDEETTARLREFRPDESTAAWAFRFLQGVPGVTMTLSGMSNLEQVVDNVNTYHESKPLTPEEKETVLDIARKIHATVPCTGCRYCCDGCPAGLDIPRLMEVYNDLSLQFSYSPMMFLESLPEDKRPSACLGCGACASMCPQGIEIPQVMEKLDALYVKYPKWSDICRNRLEEQKKLSK